MTDSAYLVLDEDGIRKLYKTKPSLKSGQRGVRIEVTMPDRYFDQPFPTIDVAFSEKDIIEPEADVMVEESRSWMIDQIESLREEMTTRELEDARQGMMDCMAFDTSDYEHLDYTEVARILENLKEAKG